MDRKFPNLKVAPRPRPPSFKCRLDPTIRRVESDSAIPTYTSLKDLISNSPFPKHASCTGEMQFDSSSISISNELVKHAASAYVLSAAVLTRTNTDQESKLATFWEKMKTGCVRFRSCWEIHVRMPLEDLCGPVIRLFSNVYRRIRTGLEGESRDSTYMMYGFLINPLCSFCL